MARTQTYRRSRRLVATSVFLRRVRSCSVDRCHCLAGANPNRTTRIFVARIPPHVSDDQFRAYFAQFGAVQVITPEP